MTNTNHNNSNQKTKTNQLAREVFEDKMDEIGAEFIHTPRNNGENYIVRYKGRNLKVRVRGTKEMGTDIYLIRANRNWFESEYAPDVFYIVSGPRYYSKKQHVVGVNDAKDYASVQSEKLDGSASFILSYNNVKTLHDSKIFGE